MKISPLASVPNGPRFEDLLAGEKIFTEEFESAFAYRIDFSRWRLAKRRMLREPRYIHNRGAAELGLNYFRVQHRRYRISTQYLTEDDEAQARTKTLLSIIDASFCRGLRGSRTS